MPGSEWAEYSVGMNKQVVIGIAVIVALVVVGFFAWRFMGANNLESSMEENTTGQQQQATTTDANVVDLGGGLFVRDITVGTGAEAVNGTRVYAKYVGRLTDGTVFDASELHAETKDTGFSFVLGNDQVIQGWHKGILGMKVGGQRLIQVPPELAYGAQAYGPIPANSTLVFAIELVKVE